jgi:hypothetical protein
MGLYRDGENESQSGGERAVQGYSSGRARRGMDLDGKRLNRKVKSGSSLEVTVVDE